MIHLNDKEKAIKHALDHIQVDINTNDIWNNIEENLPKKQSRPYFLYFLCAAILSFMTSTSILYYKLVHTYDAYNQLQSDLHSNQKLLATSLSRFNAIYKKCYPNYHHTHDIHHNNPIKYDPNLPTQESTSIIPVPHYQEKVIGNPLTDDIGKPQNKIFSDETPITDSPSDIFFPSPLLDKNLIKTTPIHYHMPLNTSYSTFKSLLTIPQDILSPFIYPKYLYPIRLRLFLWDKRTIDYPLSKSHSKITKSNMHPKNPPFTEVSTLDNNQKVLHLNIENNKEIEDLLDINQIKLEPIKNNALRQKFFLTLRSGYILPVHIDTRDLTSEQSISTLAARERGMPSLSFDMLGGWHWTRKIKSSMGLSYNNQVIRYADKSISTVDTLLSNIPSIYINKDNTLQITSGSAYRKATVLRDISRYRRHISLDFSVAMEMEVCQIKKWYASIEGGVITAIIQNHKGYYFDQSLEGINTFDPQSSKDAFYQINMRYHLGVNLGIKTPSYNFFMTPIWRWTLNNMWQSPHYTTKNSQVGLLFGLSYYPKWE